MRAVVCRVVGVVVCVVVVVAALGACADVKILRDPAPPHTTRFIGPHGRPRAFGGGVCPLRGAHEHVYGAVPAAAFVVDDSVTPPAFRDTRARVAYDGPHVWRGGRCTLPGFHEHVVRGAAPVASTTTTSAAPPRR